MGGERLKSPTHWPHPHHREQSSPDVDGDGVEKPWACHTCSAWVQAAASCWCLWEPFITDLFPWNSVGCGWVWVLTQLGWWGRVLSQAYTGTHLLLWRLSLPPFHTTSFCRMPGPPWHTGNSVEKNSSYIFLPSLESLLGEHFGQYPKPSKTVIFFSPGGQSEIWPSMYAQTPSACLHKQLLAHLNGILWSHLKWW